MDAHEATGAERWAEGVAEESHEAWATSPLTRSAPVPCGLEIVSRDTVVEALVLLEDQEELLVAARGLDAQVLEEELLVGVIYPYAELLKEAEALQAA